MRKIENTVTKQEYDRMTKLASPPSPTAKNCLCAFLVGGLICCIGQFFRIFLENVIFPDLFPC